MKVAVVPSDMGACGYYRMIWPGEAVRFARPGWTVNIYRPQDVKVGMGPRGLMVRGLDLEDLDLVVFQRVGTSRQVDLLRALQAQGIAVAVDVDDALYCIDPDSGSYASWNDRRSPTHWEHLDEAAHRADLLTVTTDALAKHYGRHGRTEKIVNGLPEFAYANQENVFRHEYVVLGWSGVQASHPHDLEVVGDALAKVMAADPDVYLEVVGDAEWAAGVLQVPPDRVLDGGRVPLDKYHAALRGTDIGLVPLADTKFNQAKSALKALEYTAAGASVIASPTPANVELFKTIPTISYPSSADEWHEHLLVSIDAVRSERDIGRFYEFEDPNWIIDSARSLSILSRAEEWATAWERAVARRKGMTR